MYYLILKLNKRELFLRFVIFNIENKIISYRLKKIIKKEKLKMIRRTLVYEK